MTRKLRGRRRTDPRRSGRAGAGKPDTPATAHAGTERRAGTARADLDELRRRLTRERDDALGRLQAFRISAELGENAPPRGNESTLDEGDAAQASERRDMSFTTHERLTRRIDRLSAALERIGRGDYGRCALCGRDIEPERLVALPEADTCLACQAARERLGAA
jgi:DnaK suppressor protein